MQAYAKFSKPIPEFPHRKISATPRKTSGAAISATALAPSAMAPLNTDAFLNELKSMFERSTEKGSVWVTLKRSSMKSKAQKNKMISSKENLDYRCLIRATDAKKKISTSVGVKEHQRFQASYALILKAHMTSLKKRERKDKRKAAADTQKKPESSKKKSSAKSS